MQPSEYRHRFGNLGNAHHSATSANALKGPVIIVAEFTAAFLSHINGSSKILEEPSL